MATTSSPKSAVVHVRVTAADKKRLHQLAIAADLDEADVIRMLIRQSPDFLPGVTYDRRAPPAPEAKKAPDPAAYDGAYDEEGS